jgi:hypothetical protein
MLFFLSKGYFASSNCKKEIDATLRNGNPIILLHETDPDRGGVPLSQIYADADGASEGWRSSIFVSRRPVIPYHRVKEFKIVSLKMIVSSMLQHQSMKEEAKLRLQDKPCFAQGASSFHRSTTSGKVADAFLKTINKNVDQHATPKAAGSSDEKMVASASKSMDNSDSTLDVTPDADAPGEKQRRTGDSGIGDLERTSSNPPESKAPDTNTLGSNLFLPGEVMRKKLSFPPTVLMLSDEIPGAQSLAKEIREKYPDLTLTHDLNDLLTQPKPAGRRLRRAGTAGWMSAMKRSIAAGGDGSGESNRLYLLYLNNQTWSGAAGIKLAKQAPRPRALPARRPPCTLCSVHSPVAATL